MNTSFLDYYKTILQKVSFDKGLLIKEYQKALKTIEKERIQEFEQWLESQGLNEALKPERVEVQ